MHIPLGGIDALDPDPLARPRRRPPRHSRAGRRARRAPDLAAHHRSRPAARGRDVRRDVHRAHDHEVLPATTLFFSAIGTALFLAITRNRLPSYLGSSFAFIAPIGAATLAGGKHLAVGGILLTGVLLAVVGLVVHRAGTGWINALMPPVVTGTIVALIGLNLAPAAWGNFKVEPSSATITLGVILVVSVFFRGILGRLSILVGVVVGYLVTWLGGNVMGWSTFGSLDFKTVDEAKWFGFPEFTTPHFSWSLLGLFVPVVLVLIAENVGHVKSVAAMTGKDLDPLTGRALFADGVATTLAGIGGGSGTTTYAENIGVMAATRVYSTAAYWVAAAAALVLSLSPSSAC
ncbi:hypothetical protein GCM10025864_02750 [Luteimicrobium album]|uniref:Nitrate reductase n=1 Tax=Luteimicrobium album TaxID=1054550 RepID=A0ABQ6HWX8_9MICO|nr:hypothetical protein GCM10025864_02750 [Luteimicrobium album]